ncbi:MAG: hypothetical protein H0U88_04210, partial [Chthoniobacterales bacterium]|nr:hypothetical protein [Chthoniobacterales bacterium]
MLYLGVGGSNLRLQSDPEQGAYLEVENRNRRAYLQLTFQPQTIAESAFFEAAIVPGGTTPIGGEGDPRRESNPKQTPPQGATYHEPFANPGQPSSSAIAAAATQKPKTFPTAAQIGHSSRLVFVVPPGAKIPFSMEGLLDWSELELNVNGIAAIGDNPSPHQIANAPGIRAPAANETAIELPYRLIISPTRRAVWLHRPAPFTSLGRTELWHTELALRTGDRVTRLSKTNLAPLRAIWSPDYSSRMMPEVEDDPQLGRTAMNANDRHQIVVLTSAFHGYEVERHVQARKRAGGGIIFEDRVPVGVKPFVPQPFHADRLILSALGGWLRSRGQWDPPRRAQRTKQHPFDLREILKDVRIGRIVQRPGPEDVALAENEFAEQLIFIPALDEQLDLSEWVHLATQGRDHYVRIVYEGELWPFRHPAALIKVTERKFEEHNGLVVAYLMQRMFIVVRKPVMAFAHDDFGNPLKNVRLTTLVTPDIADPELIPGSHRSFWVKVMVGPKPADKAYFGFHGVGQDVEGDTIDFTIPMMFVSKSDLRSTVPVAAYNALDKLAARAASVPGQKVAFAPRDPLKPTETTQLETK